jgi:glycosyltransferase involved in cell wall biosynthesis
MALWPAGDGVSNDGTLRETRPGRGQHNAKMRIGINALFMIPGEVGGSETYLRNLVAHLGSTGQSNEYVIFTNRESAGTFAYTSSSFTEAHCPVRAAFRPARVLYEQLLLPLQVRQHAIEVLHSPGYTAPLVSPCPSVVTIYDLNFLHHPEDFSQLSATTLRVLVPLAAKTCDMIATLSENSRRDIVARLKVPEEKVHVTYPAASVAPLRREGSSIQDLRLGHRINSRYILSVAASHPHKNLLTLVEAYHLLRSEHSSEHQLVIVGLRGRDHGRLLELITELSLQNEVILTGWIPAEHLALLYDSADVFVFPSLYEGFGIPVLEAMQHRVPVVSSNVSSLCEATGDATIAVDPHDAAGMAAAIRRILTDRALRANLVEKGYQHAGKFSWEQTARQTLDVYAEAVSRSSSIDPSRGRSVS